MSNLRARYLIYLLIIFSCQGLSDKDRREKAAQLIMQISQMMGDDSDDEQM